MATSLGRDGAALDRREQWVEAAAGTAFLIAAATVAALLPSSPLPPIWVLALAVAATAVASQVRFAIPSGYTVPVMLVSVPVLFMVPTGLFPLVTAAGLLVGGIPGVLRRRVSPDRLLLAFPNAWFTLGPALVLGLGGPVTPSTAGAPLLIGAFAAQLLADASTSAIRDGLLGSPGLLGQLREARYVYAVDLALALTGFGVALATENHQWALALVLPLLGLLHLFASERRQRMEQLVELSNAYRGTAMVLGDVIEADDEYTGEHCKSVVQLALSVSDALGLGPAERRKVEFGALLHDVGKVAVPKEIINKRGPLDAREWAIIKTHTVEGQRMLDTVGGTMSEVGRIVRAHHERWDGGGYPDGLAGEAIPIEARIVAACDTWHAMTSTRSYRQAMSHQVALDELRAVAGSQLDPRIVEVLVGLLEAR
ncbi:MAG: HD-GYP domain-containing protein [Thermoleophilia bacterium]